MAATGNREAGSARIVHETAVVSFDTAVCSASIAIAVAVTIAIPVAITISATVFRHAPIFSRGGRSGAGEKHRGEA